MRQHLPPVPGPRSPPATRGHRRECPPSPLAPHLGPKTCPQTKNNPNPKAKTNRGPLNKTNPNEKPKAPANPPPKKKWKRLPGKSSTEPLGVLNRLLLLLLLLLLLPPRTSNSTASFADSPVCGQNPLAPQREAPPLDPPRRPPSPAQRKPPRPSPTPHPQWRTCQGIPPCPRPRQSGRGGGGVKDKAWENVYVLFCDNGVWEMENGKEALAAGGPLPPQRGSMGEVPF